MRNDPGTDRVDLTEELVAAGTLALGLTACIAVFTYLNGFYQPFPGVDPDGLVRVFGVADEAPYEDISYLDYLDYGSAGQTFEGLAATQPYYAAIHEVTQGQWKAVMGSDSPSHFKGDKLPVEKVTWRQAVEFCKKLLREAGVAASPGIGFGDYGDDHLRFCLIENEHRTRQAVRGIRRMLRADGHL